MLARKTPRRKLRLESLEPRLLLDGNVSAPKLANGVLTLTGDAKDNAILISTAPDLTDPLVLNLVITGQPTSTLSGVTSAKPTRINGKTDAVLFKAADVQSIKIDMKDGRNVVVVGVPAPEERGGAAGAATPSLTVPKDLAINTGKDLDQISLNGILVNGNLTINTGLGADSINLVNTEVMLKTNINAGDGINFVNLNGGFLHGGLTVNTGSGHDSVSSSANVDGGAIINTGAGGDYVSLYAYQVGVESSTGIIHGNVAINAGAGNNRVSVQTNVTGNVSITTTSGKDDLYLYQYDDSTTITGNLAINGGAGNNYLRLGATVTGNVSVTTTTGSDSVDVYYYGSSTFVTGNLAIGAGDGDNYVYFNNASVKGNTSITTGNGDDYVEMYGDYYAPLALTGDLKIDTGAGADYVDIGSVAVSANPAGQGGNVSISTGAGGELTSGYSYGRASLPFHTTESVTISGLTLAKDLAVNLGDGDNALYIGSSTAANAKITSGKGSTLTGISALDLGAGTLSIQNGLGDNTVLIGTSIPDFGTMAFGVKAGMVNVATNSANTCEVLIDHAALSKSLAVSIAGSGDSAVSLDSLATAVDANFDSASIATGNGDDTLSITNTKANTVAIKTLAGNDTVAIDTVLSNSLAVDLGDGDDAVALGAAIAPTTVAKVALNGGKGIDRRDIAFADPPATWLTLINFEPPTT